MKRILLATFLCLTLGAAAQPESLATTFPGVALNTSFAFDYGEMLDSVSYQGKDYTPEDATKAILPLSGWDDPNRRLALGKVWVEDFVFFDYEVAREGGPKRRAPVGDDPVAEMLPDGSFRYTAWVISMTGRSPGRYSSLRQVTLSPQADLKVEVLSSNDPSTPQTTR